MGMLARLRTVFEGGAVFFPRAPLSGRFSVLCGGVLCAAIMGAGPPARAAESGWRSADYLQVRLSSPQDAAGTAGTVPFILDVRLDEGWHAYWRMPGDGGLAPRLDWGGSQNVEAVHMDWPVPSRFDTAGLYSFGYQGTVSFPLAVTVDAPGADVRLDLNADIMVCKDICMPQPVRVSLDLPAGPAADAANDRMMTRVRARLPARADNDDLKIESVVLGPDALVARVYSRGGFEGADLFVESGELYVTSPPVIAPDAKDPSYALLTVAKPAGMKESLADALQGQTVTVTVAQGGRALEKSYPF